MDVDDKKKKRSSGIIWEGIDGRIIKTTRSISRPKRAEWRAPWWKGFGETQFNAISRLVRTFKVVSGKLSGPFSFPWCTHTRSLCVQPREPLYCSPLPRGSRLNFPRFNSNGVRFSFLDSTFFFFFYFTKYNTAESHRRYTKEISLAPWLMFEQHLTHRSN